MHLRSELEKERSSALYRGPSAREKKLMHELTEQIAREETMWKQRSRIGWLKEGDPNTQIFPYKGFKQSTKKSYSIFEASWWHVDPWTSRIGKNGKWVL
jgi:hypothetical protein